MQMFDSSQILLPAEELKKRFEEEGKLKFILLTHIFQNSFFFFPSDHHLVSLQTFPWTVQSWPHVEPV